MNLARNLRLLLAVALLAAWQNALLHPLEHIDGHGGFVHLSGGDGSQGNTSDPRCAAIAAVAVCVDGSIAHVLPAPRGVEAFSGRHAGIVRSARLLAYRSQAPPQYS